MELTNENLQDKFREYIEGEPIEWPLVRVFHDQHGGFSRRTADEEKAVGITPKEKALVINYINIEKDEETGKLMAEQEDSIEIYVDREEYEKIKYMTEMAFRQKPEIDLNDPENDDGMFG